MSKVLLFVQNEGDKRPKCVFRWGGPWRPCPDWEWLDAPPKCRYWLVECENAEAGRLVIWCDKNRGNFTHQGRILASGGKR